jgi:hypothetical protein
MPAVFFVWMACEEHCAGQLKGHRFMELPEIIVVKLHEIG